MSSPKFLQFMWILKNSGFLQAMLIGGKTWLPVGVAIFAIYGYSENFKNLLLPKYLADFRIILHLNSHAQTMNSIHDPCPVTE